jgi:uncharacterized protein YkwD
MACRLLLALLALIGALGPWRADAVAGAAEVPVMVTGAAVAPAPAVAGETAAVAVVLEARSTRAATVEVVIADSGGAVIWQHAWPDQTVRRRKPLTVETAWPTPADLAGGDYALTVRLVDADGAVLTDGHVVAFAVVAPPAPSEPAPSEPAPSEPAPADPAPPADVDPAVTEVLVLVNDHRQAHGLPPLALQPQLLAAAAWHSQDMGEHGTFSHTDSLGRDPFQRMADFGYTANTWKGENIAAGYRSAAQVVVGWRESAGHNANLLDPNFRTIGIGRAAVAGSPYGVYWTAAFGGE